LEQFGAARFISGNPTEADKLDARNGLSRMKEILSSADYDIVIFDEINTTMHFELISVDEVLSVLDMKPEKTEVILTGRYAPAEIIDRADLVTEMREVKHYYKEGVKARTGIEK
jgi:cob(I)alamin adenosyltransferase